jgi:glyoxylase-like metal-dependent hydrolase (beta-lactamase superfamily II)
MQHWLPIEGGLYRLAGRIGGYALVRDGRCLLVDPPRTDWPAALAELGVSRVDWILATHHHRDTLAGAGGLVAGGAGPVADRAQLPHVAGRVASAAGGAQLLVPAGEVDLVARAADFWQTARTYVLYDCDSKFSALRESIPVARGLDPDESFALGPWRIQALPLRGHTRNHTGYLIEHAGRRIAFVGDAMAGGGAVHNWCDFHWDYMDFNRGHRALLEDLDGLAAARPDLLCPAHARPLTDVAGEVKALRGNLRRFSDLVEPNRVPRQRDEVYQILPHVWFIGQTCYGIVADDGAALLWDVGYPDPTRDRLTRFCQQAGVKRVQAIAFSHYHDDHCWRATEAAQGFTGTSHDRPRAEIWSHRILAEIFTNPDRFRYPCLMPDPMHVGRIFDDESFDFHGIPMRYVFLPGQTYWHAGLIVEVGGRRIALTGDNIWHPQTRDRPIVGPIISRNRYLPGINHSLAARRLLELDVNMILPAHGEAFDVTRADLEAHRDWADAVAAAVRALGGGDLSGIDCWWCRIDPFHVYVGPGHSCRVSVAVDSPFSEPARILVRLNLPAGFTARTMQDSMFVPPGGCDSVDFGLATPAAWPPGRRLPITADLVVNGQLWPEQADGLLIPHVGPPQ